MQNFQSTCGTSDRTLKGKSRKYRKLKCYNTVKTGSQNKKTPARQAAWMKFLRKAKGCTKLYKICNEDARNELQSLELRRYGTRGINE